MRNSAAARASWPTLDKYLFKTNFDSSLGDRSSAVHFRYFFRVLFYIFICFCLELCCVISEKQPWLQHVVFFIFFSAEEIHSLLKALVLFQFDKLASSLQSDYSELLQLINTGIPEIWHKGIQQSQTPVRDVHITYICCLKCLRYLK